MSSSLEYLHYLRHILVSSLYRLLDVLKDWNKLLRWTEAMIRKYKEACLERRRDFTPLCFTADGMPGREALNAMRQLGTHLAEKWERQRSQMVFYVRTRMSLALVRANSLLLRGSRDRQHRIRPLIENKRGSRRSFAPYVELWYKIHVEKNR